jgi:hypothetical protein
MATRKEVEATIRASKFRCRGKRVLKDEQVTDLRKKFDALKTLEEMVKFKEVLENGHKVGNQPVHTMEEAQARISNLIYAYPDTVGQPMCGQDVGELIIAGPLDGKEHEVICPKCGEKLDYVPAVADNDKIKEMPNIGSPLQVAKI